VGKRGHGKRGELYSFLWKRKRKSSIGNRICVHHITVSAVTRAEFVIDKISCTGLRGRWCNIIVLYAHAPSQEKGDDSKDSFYEELKQVFNHFLQYNTKLHLDFNEKLRRENIFKTTIGNGSLYYDINGSGVRMVTLVQKKFSCYEHDVPTPKHS
jgi:hypothetical protein